MRFIWICRIIFIGDYSISLIDEIYFDLQNVGFLDYPLPAFGPCRLGLHSGLASKA